MYLDESNPRHPREVTVERPDRRMLIARDRGDQEIGQAKALSGSPRPSQPVVDAQPRPLRRVEQRQGRQHPTQAPVVPIRGSGQNLAAVTSRQGLPNDTVLSVIDDGTGRIWLSTGHWGQIEEYISVHSKLEFTHGICPDCLIRVLPPKKA